MRALSMFVLVSVLAGCGGVPHHDLSGRSAAGPTFMVNRRIPRKLHLVMDPATVPDTIAIRQSGRMATGFRGFLTRSLRATLGPYFNGIAVEESAPPPSSEPHVVADVRIDAVESLPGPNGRGVLRVRWAFAIRPSEQEEYVFSFVGEGTSEPINDEQMERALQQMFQSALEGLVSKWAEGDVFQELSSFVEAAEAEPEPPTTSPVRTL